jgi:alkylation response protein AidB-like acyl-CoA dehydrogenase
MAVLGELGHHEELAPVAVAVHDPVAVDEQRVVVGRNFTLTAAQAKLKTGRLAVRCGEEAVQIHGGYGFIEEYPVCRFYRDAKILTIGEGTDEIQQLVIARALGA